MRASVLAPMIQELARRGGGSAVLAPVHRSLGEGRGLYGRGRETQPARMIPSAQRSSYELCGLVFAILMLASLTLFIGAHGDATILKVPPIPADILGWVAINDPAHNLELLGRVRLDNLELDLGRVAQAPPLVLARLQQLAELGQPRLWLLIHGLEKRGKGARKIHLTLLLARPAGLDARLDKSIRDLAGALFETEARILEDGEVRLLRGASPQQVLYQVRLPELMVVSNSEAGWRQVLAAWAGQAPSLSQDRTFQRLSQHFDMGRGVLVYCDAQQILPFLPRFGYQIRRRLWGVEDELFSFQPEAEGTDAGTTD